MFTGVMYCCLSSDEPFGVGHPALEEGEKLRASRAHAKVRVARLSRAVKRVWGETDDRKRPVDVYQRVRAHEPQQKLPVLRRCPVLVEAADAFECIAPHCKGRHLDRYLPEQTEIELPR